MQKNASTPYSQEVKGFFTFFSIHAWKDRNELFALPIEAPPLLLTSLPLISAFRVSFKQMRRNNCPLLFNSNGRVLTPHASPPNTPLDP